MKFAAALILVVASVQANSSLKMYSWKPGTETVFHYESQALNYLPGIDKEHQSGLKLSCNVRVQAFSDYSLRLQMKDIKFLTINGKVRLTENGRVIGHEGGVESHVPEEFKLHLEQPFLAHLKSGVVENLFVGKQEPEPVTNIKKSLLSQLQLDISGSQRSELESNLIQVSALSEETSTNELMTYFSTMEESIHGKCLTKYTLHQLPEYRINELEDIWTEEERKLESREYVSPSMESLLSSGSHMAKTHCQGKKYFQVTKTRDFDQCTTRPFFQQLTGVDGNCDASTSRCKDIVNRMSSSTIFVCGETANEFSIRKIISENVVLNQAISSEPSEHFKFASQVNMELLKSKPITERLQLPSDLKEEKSLIHRFRNQESLSEEIVKETESYFGIRPLLSQPGLTKAHKTLLPIKVQESEIISHVFEELMKMSNLVSESPESCSSKSDAAGTFLAIAEQMSHLSLPSLKELERKVMQQNGGEQKKHITKLFYDALSMVGTNPSTMLVIEKVKAGSNGNVVTKSMLNKMIMLAIRNVKYPTQEMLRQLVQLLKSQTVTSNHELTSTIMVQLSNLFYRAYVNPSTMLSNYPVKVYGMFGNKHSPVLVQEYIPYLVEKLEQTNGNHRNQLVRLSTISAIGKLGHIKALKPLLMVIEGKYENTEEPMVRSLAVYSLKRIVKSNQPELKPIIMSIINNPAENPDVRIAAISVLPWCQPTTAELQKIALRSWIEPSKQVSSFFASTLKSLVDTTVPELKNLGKIVRPILSLLKEQDFGMQYSNNIHTSSFIDYLKTVVSMRESMVMNKNTTIPSRFSVKSEQHVSLGAFKIRGPSFTAYTSGMDTFLEKYVDLLTTTTRASSTVREQLNKIVEALEVQTRHNNKWTLPKVFMQQSFLGLESSLYLDAETMAESMEKQEPANFHGEFNFAGGFIAHEHFALTASETGFPFTVKYAVPMVYSAKGQIKPSSVSEITAKLIPVLNGKVQATSGVISPFTGEVIGAGALMSIHASTPFEIKAKMTQGELETTVKIPSEVNGRQMKTIHAYVMPFTFKQNILSALPISRSSNLKKIMSGPSKTFETTFGEHWGINGQLIVDTDSTFTSLASILAKAQQLTPMGLTNMVRIPLPIRFSSIAMKINPSQSMTKEMNLKVKMTSNGCPFMSTISAGHINQQEVERLGFESIKQTLNKIGNGPAILLEAVFTTTSGRYSGKPSHFAIIFGNKKQNSGMTAMSFAAYNQKTASSEQVYGARYESSTKYPTIKNRWNVEALLQENIEVNYEGKVILECPSCGRKEIKLTGRMTKTEELKSTVRESAEYKQCMQKMSQEMKLSLVCRKARNMASSMDKVEFELEASKCLYLNPISSYIMSLLESNYMLSTTIKRVGGQTWNMPLKVIATANPKFNMGSIFIQTPTGTELEVHNVFPIGKYMLPLPTHNAPSSFLTTMLYKHQIPATCSIQPRSVITFDGESYGYKINDCTHLLLKEKFNKVPVAVMTKTMQQQQGLKSVKILSGLFVVELIPQASSQSIVLNGKTWTLEKNKEWIEKDNMGRIVAEFKRFEDNVYMVYIVDQMLTVWTDGRNVEVVAPQLLRSSTIGMCGDMNGEESADVKTPKMCVMKPKLAAASYILNNVGSNVAPSCSGIPTEIREEYQRESSKKCIKQEYFSTPVMAIFNRISSLIQPVTTAHVVNKNTNQICISKSMIPICPTGAMVHGKNQEMTPVTLQFVCVPRMSTFGESLEKRALSGEPLLNEIEGMPVAYSKTEFEQKHCLEHSFSDRSTRSY